jgi:TrmH family RNA methyltransferase
MESQVQPSHIEIILVRPQHSGNIGAVARSIANHGLGRLVLVDPPEFDSDRARWMAPNAHHIINNVSIYPSLETAISNSQFVFAASARTRKWKIPNLNIDQLCQRVQQFTSCSLVFGPEDSGLSNHDIQYCHALVSLPTHAHQSLNLSQAVGAFGTHLLNTVPKQKLSIINEAIPFEMQNRMINSSMRVLDSIDFFRGRNRMQVSNNLLRLLERAKLKSDEIGSLTTMSNKIYHSIRVLKEELNKSDGSQKN